MSYKKIEANDKDIGAKDSGFARIWIVTLG